jgi:oxygen-independent coproporphyrinogen-3 oxidase
MRPAETPFGVYIHWPFCAQKCPYCDFNSHVRHGGWDEVRFLSAYLRELDDVHARIGARRVSSIFFGGGTPSLMKPETTAAILDHIAKLWPILPGAEITLEANPGSVEAGRFAGYRDAGVNRVSMGLQSLRDEELRRLGRIHTVAEAKAALDIARRTFDRFSFDLIYARPGQSPVAWRQELKEGLALAGKHISLYQLTIEPDTPYAALHAAGKLSVPDPDAALALYEVTQEETDAAGLPAYEISNHAAPGEECRHNLLYWRYGEYAGVGPGAHGRLLVGEVRQATVTEKNPERWAATVTENGHGFTEITPLTKAEEADEMLLMALRLVEGLDLDALASVGGARPDDRVIGELAQLGLLERVTTAADHLTGIRSCVGASMPGEWSDLAARYEFSAPAAVRISATRRGRFVLNEIVRRLSESFSFDRTATSWKPA